jgi:hypothetical protein
METNMAACRAKQPKFVPLSLLIVAAFGGIGSYATAGADPLPYGPDTCIQGYVWRNARSGDVVCVTPAVRDTAAQDNGLASQRVDPNGAYGPNSCKQGFVWREAFDGDVVCVKQGFVWREAFDGDVVCVTPATRSQASSDNAAAASRKAANAPQPTPAAPAAPPLCTGLGPPFELPGC